MTRDLSRPLQPGRVAFMFGLGGLIGMGGVFVGIFVGSIAAANVEQLPREVRCTGLAMAYNLAVGIFGGTTPMIATWLIRETGDPISPAYYLMACVCVSIVALFFVKETAHKPLS